MKVLLQDIESERTDVYDEVTAPCINEDMTYTFEQGNRKISKRKKEKKKTEYTLLSLTFSVRIRLWGTAITG
ncbi:MAG: hypothetical protein HDR23_03230 [Lachnospiraceae bacterium]|nr:hypothetical protein [Lachnospiraceae bacterium]